MDAKVSLKNDIIEYVNKKYGVNAEHLWARTPEFAVFRNQSSGKWFGIILYVCGDKIGKSSTQQSDIIDIKCDPVMIGSLLKNRGFYPAYHMNKEHWITIVLDGTVSKSEIFALLDISFELTEKTIKK